MRGLLAQPRSSFTLAQSTMMNGKHGIQMANVERQSFCRARHFRGQPIPHWPRLESGGLSLREGHGTNRRQDMILGQLTINLTQQGLNPPLSPTGRRSLASATPIVMKDGLVLLCCITSRLRIARKPKRRQGRFRCDSAGTLSRSVWYEADANGQLGNGRQRRQFPPRRLATSGPLRLIHARLPD